MYGCAFSAHHVAKSHWATACTNFSIISVHSVQSHNRHSRACIVHSLTLLGVLVIIRWYAFAGVQPDILHVYATYADGFWRVYKSHQSAATIRWQYTFSLIILIREMDNHHDVASSIRHLTGEILSIFSSALLRQHLLLLQFVPWTRRYL